LSQRETKGGSTVPEELGSFEKWWHDGDRGFERSELDEASYARQFALLSERRYASVLEIGCGAGFFTRQLAQIADHVVAVDIAPSAIERARALALDPSVVDLRVANIMDYDRVPKGHGISRS
jgi:SAM-dependent methyltransferase